MKKLLTLTILLFSLYIAKSQTDSTLYSFFIAGHTYGQAGLNNIGLHPPFKQYFGYIQSRSEIKFGVFTGDIVSPGPVAQDWDEVDTDIDSLGLPIYFAVGNHDMEDRDLFESRYGSTYYSFIYQNDLFIILDPNIDGWSISGTQLDFLENTINNNYLTVDNIFVCFHQLLWWDSSNVYSCCTPNSLAGRTDSINFWTVIEPMFHQLPNKVIMCAGDIGAGSWSADFIYDSYDNINFVGSGMGEGPGDNFIVINVKNDKSIDYDLICLNDSILECFGELTDYQITPEIESNINDNKINEVKLYPNPATNSITIEFENNKTNSIQFYNIAGQLTINKSFSGSRKQIIDLSNIPQGIYFIRISNDSGQLTRKIIIQ